MEDLYLKYLYFYYKDTKEKVQKSISLIVTKVNNTYQFCENFIERGLLDLFEGSCFDLYTTPPVTPLYSSSRRKITRG